MTRPCDCSRPTCRRCWLADNDPRYRDLWGVTGHGPLAGKPYQLPGVARGRPPRAAPPRATPPGPGTELGRLLLSLGLKKESGCGCGKLRDAMNNWGVEGCREHREAILAQLRKSQERLGWVEKLKAGAMAVKTGLAFKLDWGDPAPGLLDEAVRRARG